MDLIPVKTKKNMMKRKILSLTGACLMILFFLFAHINFVLAEDAGFQIEISDDDGEMDYSAKIDYLDDKAKKYLEISDLTNVDFARIKIYAKSDNCPGVERHYIEVNDDPRNRIYFNPCTSFPLNFEWKTIDIPLKFLKIGKNSFLLSDESGWAESNMWIGVDENAESDKSDICWGANCNERSDGELMFRLELIQFEVEQEQEVDLDGDGIPNSIDKCPYEPETFNDYDDDDGCPDEVPSLPVPDIFKGTDFSVPESSSDDWYKCDKCYTRASDYIPPAKNECIETYDEFDDDDTGHTAIIGEAETDRHDRVVKLRVYAPGGTGKTIAGGAYGDMWIEDWTPSRFGECKVILKGHLDGNLRCERPTHDEPACEGQEAFATVNVAGVVEDDNENEITSKTIFKACCSHRMFSKCYKSELDINEDFETILSFDVKEGEEYKIKVSSFVYASACDGDAEADFKYDDGKIEFDSVEIRLPNNPPVAKGKAINPIIDTSLPGIGRKVIYPSKDVFPYVHFLGNESYDPDEGDYIVNYEWDFGDGTQESGRTADDVTHRYLNNWTKEYEVKLTVTDTCGAEDTHKFKIEVAPSKSPTGDTCWELGGYCQSMKNKCSEGYVDTYQYEGCPLGWKCCHPQIKLGEGDLIPGQGQVVIDGNTMPLPKVKAIEINPSRGIVVEGTEGQMEARSIDLILQPKAGAKQGVKVKTEPLKDEVYIESNNVSAVTKARLKIENQSLSIQTRKGYKEINVMPDEAISITEGKAEKIELQVIDEEPIYKIKSVKKATVLWLFQIDMSIEKQINAETGATKEETKPWWNILVTSY